jgi:hypothetical protein
MLIVAISTIGTYLFVVSTSTLCVFVTNSRRLFAMPASDAVGLAFLSFGGASPPAATRLRNDSCRSSQNENGAIMCIYSPYLTAWEASASMQQASVKLQLPTGTVLQALLRILHDAGSVGWRLLTC